MWFVDVCAGSALVKLGRAHCKVATLQEAYALTFQDTFLRSMEKFVDEVKDYENERKKLESRRYVLSLLRHNPAPHYTLLRFPVGCVLSVLCIDVDCTWTWLDRLNYDAALTRMEKSKHNKKEKEKDRREAEEELEKAQTR